MDSPTLTDARPVILCPLQFERQALQRAGLGSRARLVCCGPGREGVVRWAEREGATARLVILAGLAGSLRETMKPGEAYVISTVMSERRPQRRAAIDLLNRMNPIDRPRRATVASSAEVLTTVVEKRAWADRTGADLVDVESDIFAEAAEMFGWRWFIVRGVSDAHDAVLPQNIARWVDDRGRARPFRVAIGLLRRSWHLRTMLRLRRDGKKAMERAAHIIGQLLEAGTADEGVTRVARDGERTDHGSSASPAAASSTPEFARPVLIFGGTFDPPHRAHVEIPLQVAERLGCARIIYVPTSINPLKRERPTSAEHRLEMLRLALRDRQNVEIDTGELFNEGPSYTVDTLERLRRELGASQPGDLRLLIGSDAAATFHQWKDWRRILEIAQPAVVLRHGVDRESFLSAMRDAIGADAEAWRQWIIDLPRYDVSSTFLRESLRRDASGIDADEIDPAVLEYALANRLYALRPHV